MKVCRPFLTTLLADEIPNLRNKLKGASKVKRAKEEGASAKKIKTETGSKKTKGAAASSSKAAAASSSKAAAASSSKAGAGKSSTGKRKAAAAAEASSEEEGEEEEGGHSEGEESASAASAASGMAEETEAEVWVDVDAPEKDSDWLGDGDDVNDEALNVPGSVKEPTIESGEVFNDRIERRMKAALKINPDVDVSEIKMTLFAKNYLLEVHRVFGFPVQPISKQLRLPDLFVLGSALAPIICSHRDLCLGLSRLLVVSRRCTTPSSISCRGSRRPTPGRTTRP